MVWLNYMTYYWLVGLCYIVTCLKSVQLLCLVERLTILSSAAQILEGRSLNLWLITQCSGLWLISLKIGGLKYSWSVISVMYCQMSFSSVLSLFQFYVKLCALSLARLTRKTGMQVRRAFIKFVIILGECSSSSKQASIKTIYLFLFSRYKNMQWNLDYVI